MDIYTHNTGTYHPKPSKLSWSHKVVKKNTTIFVKHFKIPVYFKAHFRAKSGRGHSTSWNTRSQPAR